MAIKLAAVDLDGTILTEDKQITEETRRAVHSASAQGMEVAFCTGRSLIECDDALAALPEVRYVVLSNGARVWDTKERRLIARRAFQPEVSGEIVRRLIQYDGMISVFSGERVSIQKDWEKRIYDVFTPLIAAYTARYYIPEPALLDYASGVYGPVEKIFCIFVSEQERDRAWDAVRNLPCEMAVSAPDNLELTAVGTDKGSGLALLAEHLELERSEVMAIGDSCNDLSMLAYAGLPAAMGNADPRLKALAKIILPSNEEDGAAWALRRAADGTLG